MIMRPEHGLCRHEVAPVLPAAAATLRLAAPLLPTWRQRGGAAATCPRQPGGPGKLGDGGRRLACPRQREGPATDPGGLRRTRDGRLATYPRRPATVRERPATALAGRGRVSPPAALCNVVAERRRPRPSIVLAATGPARATGRHGAGVSGSGSECLGTGSLGVVWNCGAAEQR